MAAAARCSDQLEVSLVIRFSSQKIALAHDASGKMPERDFQVWNRPTCFDIGYGAGDRLGWGGDILKFVAKVHSGPKPFVFRGLGIQGFHVAHDHVNKCLGEIWSIEF